MKAEILKWDSIFFKKNIGKLVYNNQQSFLNEESFDLLYVLQKKNCPIQINGFVETYTDTKIVYSKSLNDQNSTIKHELNINSAIVNREEIALIYELAFESGRYSRFNLDPRFDDNDFKNLYKRWIDNSFIENSKSSIFICRKYDTIVGFITYEVFNNYAQIGLFAVNAEYQGMGIGKALLLEVENTLKVTDVNELRISTQFKNKRANSFYLNMGYNEINKITIKHFWRI